MIDEKLFVIQGENFFESDIDVHVVKKGVFIRDDETQVEDVLLTLCGKYVFDDEPDVPGHFDENWFNNWFDLGGCEICHANLEKEVEFND